MKRVDGSVESINTPTVGNIQRPTDLKMYRCMVTEVIFSDNPINITRNDTNPRVLYNVIILGGFKSGQPINNCRLSKSMGSSNGYEERILKATTRVVGQDRLSEHDGEIVYVQFNQGDVNYPVIVGFDDPIDSIPDNGATRAQGPRQVRYFNGLRYEIDNKGQMILTRQGGSAEDGQFTPAEEEQARWEFLDDKIRLKDPVQELVWCKSAKTWTHTVSTEDSAYKELIDGTNEVTTRTYKSGLKITEDGKNDKMTVITNAGAKVIIDGKNDTIEITDNDSGKLKITGNTVALGADGIELLQQLSDNLDKVLQWANSVGAPHDHLGNLGYPTTPPQNAAQYTALGTDLAAIKANVDQIKGSL